MKYDLDTYPEEALPIPFPFEKRSGNPPSLKTARGYSGDARYYVVELIQLKQGEGAGFLVKKGFLNKDGELTNILASYLIQKRRVVQPDFDIGFQLMVHQILVYGVVGDLGSEVIKDISSNVGPYKSFFVDHPINAIFEAPIEPVSDTLRKDGLFSDITRIVAGYLE